MTREKSHLLASVASGLVYSLPVATDCLGALSFMLSPRHLKVRVGAVIGDQF